jgi:methylated-DNA-[protein]-cysteine S-methyltransferase
LGKIYLVASEKGLRAVSFKKQNAPMALRLDDSLPASRTLAQASKQLEEYFSGKRKDFKLAFDLEGTPFQKSVWRELSKIPYGRTCSYSDIAKNIKKNKAVRAVGTANGKNPICIIVPCHRVIAADGGLGGYLWGLPMKTKLLNLEQVSHNRCGDSERK